MGIEEGPRAARGRGECGDLGPADPGTGQILGGSPGSSAAGTGRGKVRTRGNTRSEDWDPRPQKAGSWDSPESWDPRQPPARPGPPGGARRRGLSRVTGSGGEQGPAEAPRGGWGCWGRTRKARLSGRGWRQSEPGQDSLVDQTECRGPETRAGGPESPAHSPGPRAVKAPERQGPWPPGPPGAHPSVRPPEHPAGLHTSDLQQVPPGWVSEAGVRQGWPVPLALGVQEGLLAHGGSQAITMPRKLPPVLPAPAPGPWSVPDTFNYSCPPLPLMVSPLTPFSWSCGRTPPHSESGGVSCV